MKTILVPVDFTETSDNAASFAVDWAKRYGYEQVILFKTFYVSMFEYIAVSADYTVMNQENLNARRDETVQQLDVLRKELEQKTTSGITITTMASELPLLRGLIELLKSEDPPELIVVGSDHQNDSNSSFVSGNIIPIAKASPVKALIVPADYTYRPVKNALVPCDLTTVTSLDKLDRIRHNSKLSDARLLILDVNTKPTDHRDPELEEKLHAYLGDYDHEIHYVSDKNIISGILSFTSIQKVELIIALPGKYSFLYSLINKSISEGIYRNTHQPVLILK